jgi:hypothetical protein
MKLLDCFTTIVDPRRPQGRLYPLAPLLFVSVLAVLAGADSYRKIARFIDAHRLRLNEWLGLKWKRAPAHTAIRYAFLKLSPEALEAAFREHSAALAAGCEPAEDCIAVDGKALKGSFDAMAESRAAQVLSAFTHAKPNYPRPCPDCREVQAKTRLPRSSLKIWGSRDGSSPWMPSTVKKTFEVAQATGNHLIVQVKGNQPKLLKRMKALAREAPALSTHRQFDHRRQRIERREVRVFAAAALPAEWDGLISTVIEVRRTRDMFHPKSGEWRKTEKLAYYASDCAPIAGAPFYAQAIRGHWSIENRQHYVRDVSLGEDRSRIRHNPGIFARMRSFALNILRSSGVTNIAEALYYNALSFDRILSCVSAI